MSHATKYLYRRQWTASLCAAQLWYIWQSFQDTWLTCMPVATWPLLHGTQQGAQSHDLHCCHGCRKKYHILASIAVWDRIYHFYCSASQRSWAAAGQPSCQLRILQHQFHMRDPSRTQYCQGESHSLSINPPILFRQSTGYWEPQIYSHCYQSRTTCWPRVLANVEPTLLLQQGIPHHNWWIPHTRVLGIIFPPSIPTAITFKFPPAHKGTSNPMVHDDCYPQP